MSKNLTVPERRLKLADGEMVLFRGDHRAWHTLEQHTGRSLMDFIGSLGSQESMPMSLVYDLAWALSATDRFREQRDEDFYTFIDRLPPVREVSSFVQPLMELMTQAFGADGDEAGNASAPRGKAAKA